MSFDPALERYVRDLVAGRENVRVTSGLRALGLLGSAWGVTGLEVVDANGQERALRADLVVDASGSGSALPGWLARFGLPAPREDRVVMDLTCTSCVVRRERHHLEGQLGMFWAPTVPGLRAGAALAIEHDRFVVTLMGYLGERAPCDREGMIAYARGLPVGGLSELLRDAEPLTEPVELRQRASVRRRYERLKHLPRGVLSLGDALCSMNPAYGHGTSVVALQALALRRALDGDARELPRRFHREAAQILDVPWAMVVGADFEFPGVTGSGEAPPTTLRAYFKRALRAAAVDPAVALALYRVMHLIERPNALFAPQVVARVLGCDEPRPQASLMLVPDHP